MMPRKKLEYYARQNGVGDFDKIKLTEEECAEICRTIGIRTYGLKDCGGRLSALIDRVMDDTDFKAANMKADMTEDYNSARIPDFAAIAVFKAYASTRKT